MFCPKCGTKASEDGIFCSKCGDQLPGRPAFSGPNPVMSESAYSRSQDKKAKKTVLILGLFALTAVILLGIVAVSLIPKISSSSFGRKERVLRLGLQVLTDDAINWETEQEVSRLNEVFKKNAITFERITIEGIGQIVMQGVLVSNEDEFRKMLDEYARDWEYSFSDGQLNLSFRPLVVQYLRDQAVAQVKTIINSRIRAFGLRGFLIERQGSDKIIIELPRVDDFERIKNLIKVPAIMEWRLVKGGPATDEVTLLQASNGQVPDDAEVLKGDPQRGQGGYFLVDKVPFVTGRDLRTVRQVQDEWKNPAVSFTLNDDAGIRLERVTGANIGQMIAIILDKKVQSAPVVEDCILRTQGGIIRGRFTPEEAEDLVIVLKTGAFPCKVKFIEERTIQ